MIKPKYEESIWRLCNEITSLVEGLPNGKRNMIINRLGQIRVINTKCIKKMQNQPIIPEQSSTQIADRYIAYQAIFNAMLGGRTISFLDSSEFKVSEMHTMICYIRKHIEAKRLPYEVHGEWFEFAPGKRAKKYHITPKEA